MHHAVNEARLVGHQVFSAASHYAVIKNRSDFVTVDKVLCCGGRKNLTCAAIQGVDLAFGGLIKHCAVAVVQIVAFAVFLAHGLFLDCYDQSDLPHGVTPRCKRKGSRFSDCLSRILDRAPACEAGTPAGWAGMMHFHQARIWTGNPLTGRKLSTGCRA